MAEGQFVFRGGRSPPSPGSVLRNGDSLRGFQLDQVATGEMPTGPEVDRVGPQILVTAQSVSHTVPLRVSRTQKNLPA